MFWVTLLLLSEPLSGTLFYYIWRPSWLSRGEAWTFRGSRKGVQNRKISTLEGVLKQGWSLGEGPGAPRGVWGVIWVPLLFVFGSTLECISDCVFDGSHYAKEYICGAWHASLCNCNRECVKYDMRQGLIDVRKKACSSRHSDPCLLRFPVRVCRFQLGHRHVYLAHALRCESDFGWQVSQIRANQSEVRHPGWDQRSKP